MQPALALSTREIVLAGSAGLVIDWSAAARRIHAEDDFDRGAHRSAAKERISVSAIDDLGMVPLLAFSVGGRGG